MPTEHRPRRRAHVRRTLVLLAALVAAPLAVGSADAAPGANFQNPIVGTPNSADPWLGYYNGNYYYTATTWTGSIYIRKATTLAGLRTATETRVFQMSQTNATSNMWAPSMHLLNGPNGQRWYLYYSAGPSACCGGQRQHVLESAGTDPMGPYTYRGKLNLMPNDGWAIDGSVMTVGGTNYFVFSAFTNNGSFESGATQNLYISQMTNPWTVAATGTVISEPTYAWERVGNPVNEGPYVLQRNGRTFMTYSASFCGTPDYKLGMLELTGSNPLNRSSWTKFANPIFQRSDANGVYGPGHHTFFKSPDGTEDWIVYHANSSASQGCGTTRTSRAQKISWNSNGTPNLGVPVSTSTVLAGPAGEVVGGGGTTGYERITNRHSGLVLDVQPTNTADGANVGQYAWNGGNWQQWQIQTVGSYVRIVSRNSGKCLDVNGWSTADGGNVQQWACTGGNNQQWQVQDAGGGYIRLVNRHSGKCLDVAGWSTANGANVQQWACTGGNNQQWARAGA